MHNLNIPGDDRLCPFETKLNLPQHQVQVVCEELLRGLPEKRLVYRGRWGNRQVIVKLFLDQRRAQRHWQREKAGIEAVIKASLPTPELLFAGTSGDGVPTLVYACLPAAQTVRDALRKADGDTERVTLLGKTVELVAGMHNAGLLQNDLHLDNFLLSGPDVYVIDGDAIVDSGRGASLPMASSFTNLALFFAQLPPQMDAFMTSVSSRYASKRQLAPEMVLRGLSEQLPAVRRRRRRKYVEKCYRSCSEFERINGTGQVIVMRRDCQGPVLSDFMRDPDAFMSGGELLKTGKTSTVARVRGAGFDWVVKRYNIKGFCHAISRSLRPTRAWVSWGNAHRLEISAIRTPRAVAVMEKRLGPFRSTGYYVCDYIAGSNLRSCLFESVDNAGERQQLLAELVSLFEQFRQLGIHHGDCKATNFLVRNDGLWVLDLDAMSEHLPGPQFDRLYRRDRGRFLRNWQELPELYRWFDAHLPGTGQV